MATLHRNIAEGIINGLEHILHENKSARRVVATMLKSNRRWGSKDRKLVGKAIYDILRWKRHYEVSPELKEHSLWDLLASWAVLNNYELPDWEVFTEFDPQTVLEKQPHLSSDDAVRHSIPNWLNELGKAHFPSALWEKEMQSSNRESPLAIRVNRLKITVEALQAKLNTDFNIISKKVKGHFGGIGFSAAPTPTKHIIVPRGIFRNSGCQLPAGCRLGKSAAGNDGIGCVCRSRRKNITPCFKNEWQRSYCSI